MVKNKTILKHTYERLYRYFQSDKKRKWYQRRIVRWSSAFFLVLGVFSYLTNPFVRFNIVTDPYATIEHSDGTYELHFDTSVILRSDPIIRGIARMKAGYHIIGSRFSGGKKTQAKEIDDIIAEIHAVRFDPSNPYLISGDHFSMLYPRSLGIFYHSILDPRTALDEIDWINRQTIYLKTLSYALTVYGNSDRLSTTIVPTGIRSVALMNINSEPSDTMYSLLYAIDALHSEEHLMQTYPYSTVYTPELTTKNVSSALLENYRDVLRQHYIHYRDIAYDDSTGLVKKTVELSGTKDMTKKSSGFYDNVIFWKTTQLAQKYNLIPMNEEFLTNYKQRIIDTFWYENGGYFLEDLSAESIENHYYSSDWLIAYQAGFLKPNDEKDRSYLMKSVSYIQNTGVDEPFGLHYHLDERAKRQYHVVRWFTPDYGSTAIWSNWGMEYIKLLVHFAQITGNYVYLEEADKQLDAYEFNIKRYRGYPEVYDAQGDFYRTWFHKSVRQTGWVVSFEQAREMYKWTQENWRLFDSRDQSKQPTVLN